ncbi:MAG: hypothetical protein QFF03_04450 [Pseudomonadota bacterium]|nr:hypothetical protein [Pseudomonadota bacterium]
MAKIYQHLTTQERAVLCSIRFIAKSLCRSASTISRDFAAGRLLRRRPLDHEHARCTSLQCH